MTTYTILPEGRTVFLDASNVPLAGGSVWFYVPSTTTPKNTYQDAAGGSLNINPVPLDSNGSALIYGSGQYTMLVLDANGATVYTALTQDLLALVSGSSGAQTTAANTWTAAQIGSIAALIDGATITPNLIAANNFSVTLGGNRVLGNPTSVSAGQSGQITITQDSTGTRTLSYGTNWKFSGGTPPTLSTIAAAVDILVYYTTSATTIAGTLLANVR